MQRHRRSAYPLLLVIAAAGACTDKVPPTAIPAGLSAHAAANGANNEKVKVKTMQLAANTLRIDGPSVSGTVSIGNSGTAIREGVSLRAEITQVGASQQAVSTLVQCTPSSDADGKLVTGTCTMTFTASAANSLPENGLLVPGAATFTLHVVQATAAGDIELASKNLLVNLISTISMTATIAPTTILIDGPGATATAVIENPAKTLQGVLVQGYVVQGAPPNEVRRPTGGSLVSCGSNYGVLPPGTCTMSLFVGPTNTGLGTGPLVAGPATIELHLIQSSGSGNTTFAVVPLPVMLTVPSPVTIYGVIISPTIPLASGSVPFTALIRNTGPELSPVVLRTWISQGTARREAGRRTIQCGTMTPRSLPTIDSCSVPSEVGAMNEPAEGNGILVPGPAVLEIDVDLEDGPTTTVARTFVNVTLTMSGAAIINIDILATDLVAGQETTFDVTFYNPT